MRAPTILEGTFVRLEPIRLDHVDELLAAADGDRSTFDFTAVPADRPSMVAYVDSAVAHAEAGDQIPFVTRSLALDRIVGSTRFYDLARWDWTSVGGPAAPAVHDDGYDLVSIGHTWLGSGAQRTPVNTEAKLLMLECAFSRWGARAVRLQTDARNLRSREAITRLGCTLDGVLRSDRPAIDGSVRDSAVFSMLASEWPEARARLQERLTL